MVRVIVDSQSNRLFRGVRMEQNYDQRGGLCQVGKGHTIVTAEPISADYLEYWTGLGFSLPALIVAGPFQPKLTLSELIISKKRVQRAIFKNIQGQPSRLEFFCIEESEKRLAKALGIPAYCNFDVAIPFSRKSAFKQICDELRLPTPFWVFCKNEQEMLEQGKRLLRQGDSPFLIKADDGTGGIGCGGSEIVRGICDLKRFIDFSSAVGKIPFLLEEVVQNKTAEVSLHWEINAGELRVIGIFDQFSSNFSYTGAAYPASISDRLKEIIKSTLYERIFPFLLKHKAIGYFCCDILVDSFDNLYWVDFNPRKGAILYVYDMVQRLSKNLFNEDGAYFWHKHCKLPLRKSSYNINEILDEIFELSQPKEQGFVVITNPGIIPFGFVDITGVSLESKEKARNAFLRAKRNLRAI